jgi:DNA anti-recombination protein RmuC
MTSVVALYDALTTAPDDRARARLIAEAFERLEERYPHLADLVTQGYLRESELRLQKEIEQVRADLRITELRLQKEIEQVRADLKADIEQGRVELKADIEQVRADLKAEIERVRADLKADIEQVRADLKADIEQVRAELKLDIERVRGEVARTKIDLLKWIVPLMFAQVAAIAALVKLL